MIWFEQRNVSDKDDIASYHIKKHVMTGEFLGQFEDETSI